MSNYIHDKVCPRCKQKKMHQLISECDPLIYCDCCGALVEDGEYLGVDACVPPALMRLLDRMHRDACNKYEGQYLR